MYTTYTNGLKNITKQVFFLPTESITNKNNYDLCENILHSEEITYTIQTAPDVDFSFFKTGIGVQMKT